MGSHIVRIWVIRESLSDRLSVVSEDVDFAISVKSSMTSSLVVNKEGYNLR